MRLTEYFRSVWLPAVGAEMSAVLIGEFRSHVNHWARFAGDVPIDAITPELVERFEQHLLAIGRSPRLADRAAKRVRTILRHREPGRWPLRYGWNKRPACDAPEGSLRRFLAHTYLAEHDVRQRTAAYYGDVLAIFAKFLGREPLVKDLADQRLNEFLLWCSDRYAPASIRGYRNFLTGLWRSCFEWEATDTQPRRVRRIKVRRRNPDAWRPEQIAALVEAAERLPGRAAGIPRAVLLRALVLATYDVAFRTSDMLTLTRDCIDWTSGAVCIVQHKTGEPLIRRFSPRALEAMDQTFAWRPDRRRVFPLASPRGRRALYRGWRMLLELAGLPVDPRQGLQKLRRSAATHLCREHGIEAASLLLGHLSDVGLAKRNYVDATQGYSLPPLPPAIPLRKPAAGLLPPPQKACGA